MWTISLPLAVPVSKKKDFPLNLNHYRNAHFQLLNKAKVQFDQLVSPFLRGLTRMESCSIEYILYPPTNGRYDTSNVCAIVDKFFSDSLVNAGLIPDDNYNVVVSVSYRFGAVDKTTPRVDAIITPITLFEPKEENMQITLIQSEIEQALVDFISAQMTIKEGMGIKIELRATRGAEGFQANIDIVPAHLMNEVAAVAAPVIQPLVSGSTKAKATEPEVKKSLEEAPVVAELSQPEVAVKEEHAAPPEAETNPVGEEAEVAEEAAVAAAEEAAPVEEEAASAPKARSLFSGLSKPVNA